MPDVLWELHGLRNMHSSKVKDAHGNEVEKVSFEQVTDGKMTEAEYKKATNDLVNFLVYLGEPIKLERQHIGILVMFYLLIFFIFAYLLKDVH